jgi:hypothetical protein
MAAGSDKLLVVVGIHEGRDFAPRPGHELIIEVRFAGEVLQTDPVDHHGASSHIDINNELAWEMTRKVFKSINSNELQSKLCVLVSTRLLIRESNVVRFCWI